MTLLPDLNDSQIELNHKKSYWKFAPKEHIGKVVDNLDDLKNLIPEEERWSEVFLDEKAKEQFEVYSRSFLRPDGTTFRDYPVAYSCKKCEKIVVGFPESELENSIKLLSGREGYDLYCGNCHSHLSTYTHKQS